MHRITSSTTSTNSSTVREENFLQKLNEMNKADRHLYVHAYHVFKKKEKNETALLEKCKLYVEKVNSLTAQLIQLLIESRSRLNKLVIKSEESVLKSYALKNILDHITSPDQPVASFLDLLEITNEALNNKLILTKQPFLNFFPTLKEASATEVDLVKFLDKLFSEFSFSSYHDKGSNNIFPFTELPELTALLESYLIYFNMTSQTLNEWPPSNDILLTRSLKGDAAIVFSFGSVIKEHSTEARKKENVVGKNVLASIINGLCYFLSKNIPPEDVPAELRLCNIINHFNRHWTGVLVNLSGFHSLYQALYQHKKEHFVNNQQPLNDMQALGRAQYDIRRFLDLPENKEPSFNELSNKLKDQFSLIIIQHYDSMNNMLYHNHIKDSVGQFSEKFAATFTPIRCAQQRGSTCGDHTINNLVSVAFLGTLPNYINGHHASITSNVLRELTELSQKATNNIVIRDKINTIIESIICCQSQHLGEHHSSPAQTGSMGVALMLMEKNNHEKLLVFVGQYIERLYLLMPENITAFLHAIQINKTSDFTNDGIPLEARNKLQTLHSLISTSPSLHQHILFGELGIEEENYQPYIELTLQFLKEKQVELEERNLNKKFDKPVANKI